MNSRPGLIVLLSVALAGASCAYSGAPSSRSAVRQEQWDLCLYSVDGATAKLDQADLDSAPHACGQVEFPTGWRQHPTGSRDAVGSHSLPLDSIVTTRGPVPGRVFAYVTDDGTLMLDLDTANGPVPGPDSLTIIRASSDDGHLYASGPLRASGAQGPWGQTCWCAAGQGYFTLVITSAAR